METISLSLNGPLDWKQVARAILSNGQYVDRQACYKVECEQQVERNHVAGVQPHYDSLAGEGVHSNLAVLQQVIAQYFDQVCLCAMRAFNCCSTSKAEPLTKLLQKANEEFTEFVSQVQKACQCKVQHQGAREALEKELIFEGANPTCKAIIGSLRAGGVDDWIMACRETTDNHASALVAVLAKQFEMLLVNQQPRCFNCKGTGHFAKECPQKGQAQIKAKLPTVCS